MLHRGSLYNCITVLLWLILPGYTTADERPYATTITISDQACNTRDIFVFWFTAELRGQQ